MSESKGLDVFVDNLNKKKVKTKFEAVNTRICQINLNSGEYVWIKKDTVVNFYNF